MLQLSLEFSLVRMCESFETERQRADEELTRRQEELAFLATHDALTGLPNRTLILDRVEQMLARARRSQTPGRGAVHRPRQLQEHQRHARPRRRRRAAAGGRRAARAASIRDTDALGRLGGDEFVVIAEELSLAAGPGADRRAPARGAQAARSSSAPDEQTASDRDREHRHRGRRARPRPRSCCATPTSRCTAPSGTARTATSCSRRGMQDVGPETAWNSRWTCARRSSKRRVLPRLPAHLRPRAT